jgi:hypothetical protein
MKQAKWIFAVTLMVLSGIAAAQVMSSSARIAAQVPFEFVVANKIVPAGDWVVQTGTMDGKTLTIRNTDAKLNLFAAASPTENKQNAAECALVFERYGDQYFLSGIKLQGSKIAYNLPESRAEAELRAQNMAATEVILLASLK